MFLLSLDDTWARCSFAVVAIPIDFRVIVALGKVYFAAVESSRRRHGSGTCTYVYLANIHDTYLRCGGDVSSQLI